MSDLGIGRGCITLETREVAGFVDDLISTLIVAIYTFIAVAFYLYSVIVCLYAEV